MDGLIGDEFDFPQKPKRERKPSLPWALAKWFVEEFLHQDWNTVNQTRILKEAKLLLKDYTTKVGVYRPACTIEEVKTTLLEMERGTFHDWRGGKPSSLSSVRWGTPRTFWQRVHDGEHVPPPPPVYETAAYKEWVERYGQGVQQKQ